MSLKWKCKNKCRHNDSNSEHFLFLRVNQNLLWSSIWSLIKSYRCRLCSGMSQSLLVLWRCENYKLGQSSPFGRNVAFKFRSDLKIENDFFSFHVFHLDLSELKPRNWFSGWLQRPPLCLEPRVSPRVELLLPQSCWRCQSNFTVMTPLQLAAATYYGCNVNVFASLVSLCFSIYLLPGVKFDFPCVWPAWAW